MPSKAFIPYIYEPKKEDLNRTSINFGQNSQKLINIGQAQEAAKLARLAVRLNPKDERLWAVLAQAQIKTNLLNEASYSLTQARKLNPKNASLWFLDGFLHLQQKKSDKAVTIVMEDPEDIATIDSVKRLTGLDPDIVVGGTDLLNKAMDQLYGEITKAGQVEEAIQGITVISGDEESSEELLVKLILVRYHLVQI